MSEQEQEIRDAAAAGAAAAVDAVVTEQHDEAREDAIETASAVAAESAVQASTTAEQATAVASDAVVAASEAQRSAVDASATAEQAAAEASDAKSEVSQLGESVAAGFRELRDFITSKLTPPEPSNEPTEVVVTHASETGKDTGQDGTNAGGGESSTGNERTRRHKWGRG